MILFRIRDYPLGERSLDDMFNELILDNRFISTEKCLHAGNIIKHSPELAELIELDEDQFYWTASVYENILYFISNYHIHSSFAVYEYELSDTEFREVFFDEKEIPPTNTKFLMKLEKDLIDITNKINKLINFS